MARNIGLLVCLLVMMMDVVAGILGIEAELAQNKVIVTYIYTSKIQQANANNIALCKQVDHLKVWIFECRDPSHKAFKLGLSAAIILALAHTIGNLFGGCFCLWSTQDFNNASANKKLAFGSLLLSWYAYFNTQFQMNSLTNSGPN